MTSRRVSSSLLQPSRPPRPPSSLLILLTLLLSFPSTSLSQQIGSFFTAIYLNGAPVASNQESCSNMGQGQYCCGAGQSCAWDDSGHVACCASGSNCQGSPYGGAGAGAGAYNYQGGGSSSSSYYQVTPITTTVFTGQTNCNCQSTPNNNVVPVVPVSTPPVTITTSYYVVPTSTYYPASATTTTTVPGQGQGQVTEVVPASSGGGNNNGVPSTKGLIACATVSTITEANVGQPVRTVGCLIIFNKASRTRGDLDGMTISMMVVLLSFDLFMIMMGGGLFAILTI